MKPIWKDGKLGVELHKPEVSVLERCREIGQQLAAMHQAAGAPLVAAINAVLEPAPPADGIDIEA